MCVEHVCTLYTYPVFSFFEIGTPHSVVRTDITKLITFLFSYAVTLVIKSDFVSYGAFSILDTMA
jgi:hypothetical protein